MQIKPAVLLAVLSASAASAIKLALYDGKNCDGNWVEDHNVYEHKHKYSLPGNVWSARITNNPNRDVIRLFEGKPCSMQVPGPAQDAIDNMTGGCIRGREFDNTCYIIDRNPN